MKKRRLKIKFYLLISLVVILGTLSILYATLCRGKGYNEIPIDLPETTTEYVEETPVEPVEPEEIPEESTTLPEETTTKAPVKWDKYNPEEELAGENWALTLISKKYPLGKTYSPILAPVTENSSITADSRVAEAYKKMYGDALKQNIVLTPYAGYCSYNRQKTNYDNKVNAFTLQGMTYDEAVANAEKRIEPAGSSENGAGLSVDIISASAGFASTNEYKWLTENAHNYGFILRYPEDKVEITGMIFQPWHWRYVGVTAATEMKTNNQCLEEYLEAV